MYLDDVFNMSLSHFQGMKDYADQQRRLQQDIKLLLERNQQNVLLREEEERRLLEEKAELQAAVRQSVQSAIASAQEDVEAKLSALEVRIHWQL